ncbi:MAG: inositol monophosphatase [Lachnospiraceae bacterium]|nr:inositol monophosphatase [Lachnospiraceae bacterium]
MSNDLFFKIQDIVLQSGKLIEHVETIDEIKEKEGEANFVTRYDSMVQSFLIENLLRLLPEATFLCEEDGRTDTPVQKKGYTFIIDPIDGTTNFICGFQMSAVSVALAVDGEVRMGFVLNPFTHDLFSAVKGSGACLNGRLLRIPNRSLQDSVVISGTAPYNTELREHAFSIAKAVSYHTRDIRELGSAALGICYVACGRCAAYTSPLLCPWDYAAGALIVEESGGCISDWQGKRPDYQGKTSFVAAAPAARQEFLAIVSEQTSGQPV